MPQRSLTGARAIITGASSGIGWALATQLAHHQAQLLICARRAERLEKLSREVSEHGGQATVLSGDVTSPQMRQRLIEGAQRLWGGLDLLINNAGVGATGLFCEARPDRLRQVMEINFFAPAELIRLAVPLLREGRRPMIVNIGSVLGHRAVPLKSEYCASKFALHGLSDAIRTELHQDGIDVLHVCPSTTSSEFFDSLIEDRGNLARREGMSADQVARHTLRAIERGQHEIVLSAGGRALVWIDRLCPPLADFLIKRFC